MKKTMESFGSKIFNEEVMKEKLSKDTWNILDSSRYSNTPLDLEIADEIAQVMMEWALEHGVTHYAHWFKPLTGKTAQKYTSLLDKINNQHVIKFSGKELLYGEPDASSFPNGGLRSTDKARGYTLLDINSYAFIKNTTLYIPCLFFSYTGESLDLKTPLLKSMQALNTQSLRVLKLLGKDNIKQVYSNIGLEQEYFLVDKDLFDKRLDLQNTGRTLFGTKPSKGQELEDHYFAVTPKRVQTFFNLLNSKLWELGIYAKNEHNEVAPNQFELASIYTESNLAIDHNQIVMEYMKEVAKEFDLVALLHEKPFSYINGSGKHNNWSIITDTQENLLNPDYSENNLQFLVFLSSIIKAVDDYQDILRASVANAGNKHRLGASEAPPAIISLYLGDTLNQLVEDVINGKPLTQNQTLYIQTGLSGIVAFEKDDTDRNRTSPFAFTGNKFEFRMPGSSDSISLANTVLNTIVADALKNIADEIESKENNEENILEVIRETLKKHKRILFNGDGYGDEWILEAKKRGLSNNTDTPKALETLIQSKAMDLFERHQVLSQRELEARYHILLEQYQLTLDIEVNTMIDVIDHTIMVDVLSYESSLVELSIHKKSLGLDYQLENTLISLISDKLTLLYTLRHELERILEKKENTSISQYTKDIEDKLNKIRECIDDLESNTPHKYWSLPTYNDLLKEL